MIDGSVLYTAPVGWTMDSVAWDGSMATLYDTRGELPARVVDTRSGATLFEVNTNGRFNHSGSLLATRGIGIYRIEEGDETSGGPDERALYRFFSPDGTRLAVTSVLADLSSAVRIYDTGPLLDGQPLPDALLREFKTHKVDAAFGAWSEDSTLIAIGALGGGLVKVLDPRTGNLLQEFDTGTFFDRQWVAFHPTEPHIYTIGPNNTVRVYTHDVDELLAIARSRLTREMSDEECQQYFREPCPTS